MRKITLGMVCMMMIGIQSFSQSTYNKAIGIRLSGSYYDVASVSYKFFISEAGAIELNGGFGARNYTHSGGHYGAFALSAAAGYQHHFNIKPVEGLRWFIGGGATVYNVFSDDDQYEGFAFGLFPTGGIDYKFAGIPLNVSADLRPTFFLANPEYYPGFHGTNFGIAARYTIGQR